MPSREGVRCADAPIPSTGDDQAIGWATQIVTRLRGEVLRIPQSSRPLYHAAAVMASNYVVGLMDAAQQSIENGRCG